MKNKLKEITHTELRVIFLFLITCWLLPFEGRAQQLKAEALEALPTDIAARKAGVRDLNDNLCPMIRVGLPIEGCKFEGNILTYSYDVGEYLVFLSPGTKMMRIKTPSTSPLDVTFSEISDIEALEPGMVYRLALSGYEGIGLQGMGGSTLGNYLILNVTPKKDIFVRIDNVPQKVTDGQCAMFLPFGEHKYEVQANGYAPKQGTVIIKENGNTNLSITLESIMATLDINPVTPDATILLNNKSVGKGSYSGKLNPGVYFIEVSKYGYASYTQTVELKASEQLTLTPPALTKKAGTLNVAYSPIGASIMIDNSVVGKTPMVVRDLSEGRHSITISKEGYETFKTSVTINEGETEMMEGELSKSHVNTLHYSDSDVPPVNVNTVTSPSGEINGHEYVDLGLPSGTLWAYTDLRESGKPDLLDADVFGWGAIKTAPDYRKIQNVWDENRSRAKKIMKEGITNISGDPNYDVATLKWGEPWCIPTVDDFQELMDCCEFECLKVKSKNVQGYLLGLKITGPNGNSIFMYDDAKSGYKRQASNLKKDPDSKNPEVYTFYTLGTPEIITSIVDNSRAIRPVAHKK